MDIGFLGEGVGDEGMSSSGSVQIRVVYPSMEFKAKKDAAVATQAGLLVEAQEHYELIRKITKDNLLGYRKWLKDMQSRKSRVRHLLDKKGEWASIS